MRTTIDLPDDLHRIATAIARDARTSLSDTVSALLRAALAIDGPVRVSASSRTPLHVVSLGGGVVTSADVRALDDD